MKESLDEQVQLLKKLDWDWIRKTREDLYDNKETIIDIPEPKKTQKVNRFHYLFVNALAIFIIGVEIRLLYMIESSNIGLSYATFVSGLIIVLFIVKLRYLRDIAKRVPTDFWILNIFN
jgi:hypothetical protein